MYIVFYLFAEFTLNLLQLFEPVNLIVLWVVSHGTEVHAIMKKRIFSLVK